MPITDWLNSKKWLAWILEFAVVIAVTLLILTVASDVYKRFSDSKANEVAMLRGMLISSEAELKQAKNRATMAEQRSTKIVEDYSTLLAARNKRAPMPPQPAPVPVDAPAVASALAQNGLLVGVGLGTPPNLTLPQGQLILTWHGQALRVPGLEMRIADDEVVIGKSVEAVQGLQDTISLKNEELARSATVTDISKKAFDASQKELGYTKKELAAKTFKNNIKIVVLVPTFTYIGYRIGKRR